MPSKLTSRASRSTPVTVALWTVTFFWCAHEVAERVADGRGLEQAARELVEERLEGVVVVAVDEHDLGVGVRELLGGADAGEASAEDQDARLRRRRCRWHSLSRAHVIPLVDRDAPDARRRLAGLEHDEALPVRNAFGGQVIGSTARLRRRTLGSGSPVKSSGTGSSRRPRA